MSDAGFSYIDMISFQVGPVLSDTFLQSPCTSQEAPPSLLLSPCLWLNDSSCQSPSPAYIPPPSSSSLYSNHALIPFPTHLLSSTPGCNSYHGDLYTTSSPSAGDWMLPDSLSWGQGCGPGEYLPACASRSACVSFVLMCNLSSFAQSSASAWAVGRRAPPCGGETLQVDSCVTPAASDRKPTTHRCWDRRDEL